TPRTSRIVEDSLLVKLRATMLLRQGETEAALTMFKSALQYVDRDPQAFWGIGTAQTVLGRLEEAEDHLRRTLLARPDYADAWYALGNLRVIQEDVPAAEVALARALALKPTY